MKEILDYDPFTIEPKIGYWEAMCCELDTFLIRDTDDDVFDVEDRQEFSKAVFKTSYDAALFFFADGNNSYESKTVEDLEAKIIKYDKEVQQRIL